MTRQTLFAYLPEEDRTEQVVSVAATLARRNEAHLIGAYVMPPIGVYPMVAELPQAVYDGHLEIHREHAAAAQKRFEAVTDGDRFVAEWRTIDSGTSPVVTALLPHVRSADMVVVPYYGADADEDDLNDAAEALAMESGRPILLVPPHARADTVGEHVTVAWDGSRESTRAVFDAMDILLGAKSVRLLSVGPPPKKGSNAALPGAEMAAMLARRGVRCEADHVTPSDMSVGETILGRIGDMGSDMLVMGLYGHSKLREFVFGGVTRHVLKHMTVPVLVSH